MWNVRTQARSHSGEEKTPFGRPAYWTRIVVALRYTSGQCWPLDSRIDKLPKSAVKLERVCRSSECGRAFVWCESVCIVNKLPMVTRSQATV